MKQIVSKDMQMIQ